MSGNAVDGFPRYGGPDDGVADCGWAGSSFAHLSCWCGRSALERSHEGADYEQRH
jgi:hypothetical protein